MRSVSKQTQQQCYQNTDLKGLVAMFVVCVIPVTVYLFLQDGFFLQSRELTRNLFFSPLVSREFTNNPSMEELYKRGINLTPHQAVPRPSSGKRVAG